MRNFVQPGHSLDLVAPYDVSSGALVAVGALVGVAGTTATTGEVVAVHLSGVFTLPKATSADNAQAWGVGDLVYFDATAKRLTRTAAGNRLVGAAVQAAAKDAATGTARLDGASRPAEPAGT